MRRRARPRNAIRIAGTAAALAALAALSPVMSAAQTAPVAASHDSQDAWSYCRTAAGKVERARAMPSALLQAITLVETGRRGPDGAHTAWPWTVNAEGKGFYFATKGEAVWAVRRLMADGVRSIDVGCMQVNLRYHPRAFTSLEEAFDPMANMAYAASFLDRLHARHGSWRAASARYHSYNPELREKYAARVDKTLARERQTLTARDSAPALVHTASVPRSAPETEIAALGLRPGLIPGLRRGVETTGAASPAATRLARR